MQGEFGVAGDAFTSDGLGARGVLFHEEEKSYRSVKV